MGTCLNKRIHTVWIRASSDWTRHGCDQITRRVEDTGGGVGRKAGKCGYGSKLSTMSVLPRCRWRGAPNPTPSDPSPNSRHGFSIKRRLACRRRRSLLLNSTDIAYMPVWVVFGVRRWRPLGEGAGVKTSVCTRKGGRPRVDGQVPSHSSVPVLTPEGSTTGS